MSKETKRTQSKAEIEHARQLFTIYRGSNGLQMDFGRGTDFLYSLNFTSGQYSVVGEAKGEVINAPLDAEQLDVAFVFVKNLKNSDAQSLGYEESDWDSLNKDAQHTLANELIGKRHKLQRGLQKVDGVEEAYNKEFGLGRF